MIIVPRVSELDLLTKLLASAGYITGGKIHLYKTSISLSGTTVLADFTEADYDGYAAATVTTWNSPVINVDGKAEATAPGTFFSPTGSTTPNTIYGYYFTDSTGGILLFAESFDTPQNMSGPTSGFTLVPDLTLSSEV